MTQLGAPVIPDARNWRDRASRAAAADIGRAADAKTISEARQLVAHWRFSVRVGLRAFAALGAVSGRTATALLLRPADGLVHSVKGRLRLSG